MENALEKYSTLIPTVMKFQAGSFPFQSYKFTEPVTKFLSFTERWESHACVLVSGILSAVCQLMTAVVLSSGVERVFFFSGLLRTFKAEEPLCYREGSNTCFSF